MPPLLETHSSSLSFYFTTASILPLACLIPSFFRIFIVQQCVKSCLCFIVNLLFFFIHIRTIIGYRIYFLGTNYPNCSVNFHIDSSMRLQHSNWGLSMTARLFLLIPLTLSSGNLLHNITIILCCITIYLASQLGRFHK